MSSGGAQQGHALVPLAADRPIYAIGDVHGCKSLLLDLLTEIYADASVTGLEPRIVLLGDMVDRGEDSSGVLELVSQLATMGQVLPILGNHERMMLRFLENPRRNASWLDMGGFETFMSYGLAMDQGKLRSLSDRRLQQTIEAYFPATLRGWLEALPLGYHATIGTETVVFAHAGLAAEHPLSGQPEDALLWGAQTSIPDGLRLIHGHFVCNEPGVIGNRIEVDTGAWKTGRLSAVRIWQDEEPRFLSVQDTRIIRHSNVVSKIQTSRS